jgi:hypothetical protein
MDFWFALGEKAMSALHQDMAAAEDSDLVTVDDGNSIQGSALSLIFWIIAYLVSLSDILRCWTESQGLFRARVCWWIKFVRLEAFVSGRRVVKRRQLHASSALQICRAFEKLVLFNNVEGSSLDDQRR